MTDLAELIWDLEDDSDCFDPIYEQELMDMIDLGLLELDMDDLWV